MRAAGRVAHAALDLAEQLIHCGTTTEDMDRELHQFICHSCARGGWGEDGEPCQDKGRIRGGSGEDQGTEPVGMCWSGVTLLRFIVLNDD